MDWGIVGPVFLFSALGGALFGYDIGATSGALPSLTSPELSGTDWCACTLCAVVFGLALPAASHGPQRCRLLIRIAGMSTEDPPTAWCPVHCWQS